MTKSVGVHEAKTHLSCLLEDVAAAQEVVISSRGIAVARLVPYSDSNQRVLGADRGVFEVPDDFDNPLPAAVLDTFEA